MSENSIPITRPPSQYSDTPKSIDSDIPEQFIEKVKYPTEIVDLPTKGWFYPSDSPLSSGTIEIKMMTAREEDILTSENLIKKGLVLRKLLESLIVNKKVKLNDVLICDINGLYIAIRRLAYGDSYGPHKVKCPSCGEENEYTIDLSKIEEKPFSFEKYEKGLNSFSFQLPYSKKNITYKLPTFGEDDAIDLEIKSLSKINKDRSTEITTRLKHVIQSIDSDSDKSNIRKFVETELVSRDSFALRKYIKDNTPELDMSYQFVCNHCGYEERIDMPLTVQFFWPSS